MTRPRRVRWLRAAWFACGVGLASVVISGCTSPRDTLGPVVSPCFTAIAVARGELGEVARFAGVNYASEQSVKDWLARANVDTKLPNDRDRLCVVAFRGTLKGSTSTNSSSSSTHSMVIVVVSLRPSRILAKVEVARLPVQFGRSTFAP